jgi:hypothetical protein
MNKAGYGMIKNALRIGAIGIIAIICVATAVIWFERDSIPLCPLANGVSAISRLDDAPPSLVRALTERIGEVVPAGTEFDATDVVVTGKHRRLIFIWNLSNRWIVATEHGGVGYTDPIFAFDLSQDGRQAMFVQERVAFPDSVCSTASSLLAFGETNPATILPKDAPK